MRLHHLALVVLSTVALAGTAQAQIQTFTFDVPEQTVPFTESFTLPGFDPALGTLTEVEITTFASVTATVEVLNTSDDDLEVADATATIPIDVTGPSDLSLQQDLTAGPFGGTALADSTTELGIATVTGTESETFTDVMDLTEFTTDTLLTFAFSADAGEFAGTGPPGSVFFGGSASALGTITVVYTFIPIPEPSSLVLVGLGGVALLAGRKVLRRA